MKKRFVPLGTKLPRFTGTVILITALACAPEPVQVKRGKKNDRDGRAEGNSSDSATPGRRLLNLILEVVDTLTGRGTAEADLPEISEKPMSRVTLIFREIPKGTVSIQPKSVPGKHVKVPADLTGEVAITIGVPMNVLYEPDFAFLDAEGRQIGRFWALLRTETFVTTYEGLYPSESQQVLEDYAEIITFEPNELLELQFNETLWLLGQRRRTRRLHLVNSGASGNLWIKSEGGIFVYNRNRLFLHPITAPLALTEGAVIGIYPLDTDSVEAFSLRVTRAK